MPELFPYQEVGAAFLASHDRAGLFDVMGLGKSAQTVRALDLIAAKRILVICPAAVREVWIGEFRKFGKLPRKIIKGKQIQDLNWWMRSKCDVLVVSYEMAAKWGERIHGDMIRSEIIDAIVFDEAHYLKSPSALRTKAALGNHCDGKGGFARWGRHVWFLTGTPMPNDPVDIWSMLRFCEATTLTWRIFTDRYFRSRMGTYSARQTPREEMIPELRGIIADMSIRRSQKEVGLQLPPIWLTTQTVDGDTVEIRNLLKNYPGLESAIVTAIEQGGLSFLDAQHIATLRRLVGEAKAPAYAELLVEEFKNGKGKTVIMGLHTKALQIIYDHLTKHGLKGALFRGDTSEAARVEAIRALQNDNDFNFLVGNIKAAGTGQTMTAAADIDMFESDWSPAGNAQALMRVYRIGQTQTVHARFISLAGSIDEVVSETVARKTTAIVQIDGVKPEWAS